MEMYTLIVLDISQDSSTSRAMYDGWRLLYLELPCVFILRPIPWRMTPLSLHVLMLCTCTYLQEYHLYLQY